MNKFRRLLVFILTFAMCFQMVVPAYAANDQGVTYVATLNTPEINVSDEAQEVVLTVKASKKVNLDSITAQVHTPAGLVLSKIENEDLGFGGGDINKNNGMIAWSYDFKDGDYLTTDTLAVVTFTVPANTAAGEYFIKFDIRDITIDYGTTWEDGENLTATLTIKESEPVCNHEDKTYIYEPNNDGTHKVKCECGQYKTESENCSGGTASSNALAICQYCGATYGSYGDYNDVTYEAILDTPEIDVSDEAQEVVLTVKASKKVNLDSITAQVHTPAGLVLSKIENEDLGFDGGDINTNNGMIGWSYDYEDGDYLTTDTLAVVTFTVPANTAAGEYVIKFDILDITIDYGTTWEDGENLTATLTIKECDHEGTEATEKEPVTEADCENAATFRDIVYCTECGEIISTGEVYDSGAPLGHTWGAVSYNWGTDYADCTATRTCTVETCGKKEEETVTTTSATTEGNCVVPARTTYTADFTADWPEDQTKTIEGEKNPAVHYGGGTLGYYKDNGDGTHSFICGPCGRPVEGKTGAHENNCVYAGNCKTKAEYVCSKCNLHQYGEENLDIHAAFNSICVDNEDDATHTVKWPCCNEVVNAAEPHNYVDGVCACTAVEHVCDHDHYDTTETIHQSICSCGEHIGEAEPHDFGNDAHKCVCGVVEKFAITWTVNGETNITTEVEYGAAVTAPGYVVPEHYTFSGWDVPETMPAEDLTLNATLTVRAFLIDWMVKGWNADGTEAGFQQTTVKYGDPIVAPKMTWVREGYIFSGWQNVPEKMPADNIVIYGEFVKNFGTVTWVVDGDTFTTTDQTFNTALVLPTSAPTKTGYTFAGWFTAADGGEEVTAETVFKNNNDTTVYYAQWTANKYQINWRANGGYMFNQTYLTSTVTDQAFGAVIQTPANNAYIQRSGYAFTGWNTKADGTGELLTGETIMTEASNTAVVYYAQWKHVAHEYDYNCDKVCNICGEETRPKADHASNADHPCQDGQCEHCGVDMPATAEHTGGTAYCNALAICDECGERYGSLNAGNHAGEGYCEPESDNTHHIYYSCCGTYGETVPCSDKAGDGDHSCDDCVNNGITDCVSDAVYSCQSGNCVECNTEMPAAGDHASDYYCDKICNICGEEAWPYNDHEQVYGCDTQCQHCGEEIWPDAVCESDADYSCEDGNCIYCGESVAAAEDHEWAEPDCVNDGYCINCGEPGEAALGHGKIEGWDYVEFEDYHEVCCLDCGDYSYQEDHDYGDDHECVCGAVERYTITFMNGDKVFKEMDVAYGLPANFYGMPIPDVPIGYSWDGWHTADGTKVNPGVTWDKDVVCYATFKINTYTITLMVDGEQYGEVLYVTYGDAVTLPAPTKAQEGCTTYTFAGWNETVPETMPAENLTFTGSFTEGTSHTGVNHTENAKEATCTAEGYTGDTVCECGVTVADGEATDIDLTNHTSEEITYTDNEDGETHTKAHACCETVIDEKEAHEYVDGECVCGAEEPVNAITVIEKGGIDYEAVDNVVTVTRDDACKVGYWDEAAGKYVAITAVPNEDGSYSFVAPEGVTEVLVVVKGDVNGDGQLNVRDITALARNQLPESDENYAALDEAWQQFVADVNGDGNLNVRDITTLAKTQLHESDNNYAALTW